MTAEKKQEFKENENLNQENEQLLSLEELMSKEGVDLSANNLEEVKKDVEKLNKESPKLTETDQENTLNHSMEKK